MPLTLRTNGNSAQNLVQASWWNDFMNLFTGQMTDQLITFKPNTVLQAISGPPTAPSAVLAAGGSMGIGVYQYAVSYQDATGGETLASPLYTASPTTAGNQSQTLTLPIGPAGVAKRVIYRSKVNGGGTVYSLTTINDNTTTTYTDTNADTALSTFTPHSHPSCGGTLYIKDASGNGNFQIFSNGSVVGPSGMYLDNFGSLGIMNIYQTGTLYLNSTSTPFVDTTSAGIAGFSHGNLTTTGNLDLKSTLNKPYKSISGVPVAGTGLGIGTYQYVYTVVSADGGESTYNTANGTTVVTTSGNQQAKLTLPALYDVAVAYNIYRTLVGGSTFYYVAQTTSTSYTDSTPDTSISSNLNPPLQSTASGSISIWDTSNNGGGGHAIVNTLILANDGSLYSPSQDLYIKSNSNISLQIPNGSTIAQFNTAGMKFYNPVIPVINVPTALGIKLSNGTKIGEFKGNGNLAILGSVLSGSGNFDSFDVAETYHCDQVYAPGTILCPDPVTGLMVQCTHDACTFAVGVSTNPGLLMGAVDDDQYTISNVALCGRIPCKTAYALPIRTWVTSDGRGGVRAIASGETALAIGYTLNATVNGMVTVFLRSTSIHIP